MIFFIGMRNNNDDGHWSFLSIHHLLVMPVIKWIPSSFLLVVSFFLVVVVLAVAENRRDRKKNERKIRRTPY